MDREDAAAAKSSERNKFEEMTSCADKTKAFGGGG
jgi:hypothetical protein